IGFCAPSVISIANTSSGSAHMGRIGRSFQLVGQSYRVLMQDKELMVLPLMSGLIVLALVAAMAVGFGLSGAQFQQRGPETYIPIFLMYVVAYSVGLFFQAAVVAGAIERMRGGDPTIGSALGAASRRIGPILMWAVVAATVGTLLRMVQDRVGFLGKIVVAIAGAAWSLATFFVVPVLVLEDRSMRESFTRSVSIFKTTWGETMVGGVTLGMAGLCAWVTLIAVTGLLAYLIGVAAVAFFVIGAVALMVLFNTLNGVYLASLYRYATEGEPPAGFDAALLAGAFKSKT
ncbi:MAG: DUF6159 family protein, partial [Acidobacteriota bacterium]